MSVANLDFSSALGIFFFLCVASVLIFEFVNGFHDTANAVATVIYTRTLKPVTAVVWSGFVNFLGVISSSYIFGMAVAMKIAALLPLETVLSKNMHEAIAMVLAAILGAIIWNLGTWYFGIPCSSSHTMIGSLLGVGIVFSMLPEYSSKAGVNWGEAYKIGNSLLISPLFGFSMAIVLMFILKRLVNNKQIFKEPEPDQRPPIWLRAILFLTCTLVSFFHGSNDGQKGVGLMLIVLLAFMPVQFALSPSFDKMEVVKNLRTMEDIFNHESAINYELERTLCAKADRVGQFATFIESVDTKDPKRVMALRKEFNVLSKELKIIVAEPNAFSNKENQKFISKQIKHMSEYTSHIPYWVILAISLSLGLGTMIGWKRIVVTIGEKIGKNHMTFAEGASAELVASGTIGLASGLGLPVSTTHVLSSGVAGAMVASKGTKNLQAGTVKNIVLAWVLTLPATIIISGLLFYIFRLFIH